MRRLDSCTGASVTKKASEVVLEGQDPARIGKKLGLLLLSAASFADARGTGGAMPHVYKYLSPATAMIVLENRTLRWSTPPLLNDPFDMQFAFQIRHDFAALLPRVLNAKWDHVQGRHLGLPLNALGRMIREHQARFRQFSREEFDRHMGPSIERSFDEYVAHRDCYNDVLREFFGNDKIFCVSGRPDIILMWSHYASNHTGVVLRFRTDTPDNPFGVAREVDYVDEMPSLYTDDVLVRMLAGYSGLDHEALMRMVVGTKSAHWSYEQELRIYSGAGRSPAAFEDVAFGRHEIDGLIFGARTSQPDRQRLTALAAAYPNIELLRATVSTAAFGIDIAAA